MRRLQNGERELVSTIGSKQEWRLMFPDVHAQLIEEYASRDADGAAWALADLIHHAH